MKLKKWLAAAGAPKSKLDSCFDKDSLLVILPDHRDAGMAAAAGGAAKPPAAAATAAATKPPAATAPSTGLRGVIPYLAASPQ